MGGSNCALSNCPAYKSKHRGLSFHKIPRKGENDAHRQLLIQTIDREDEWFMKEKKKDNANIFICSRHYSGECYKHTPGNQKPTLIPGSVPTLIMPVKSVETPKPDERKPPVPEFTDEDLPVSETSMSE
ncbi:hypothetical protein ACOMHN_067666 [Nucella lapillus]